MLKKKIVPPSIISLGAALLVLTQTAGSNNNQQANELEGAWIAKGPASDVTFARDIQATYVLNPTDPSGRHATISGLLQVRIPIDVFLPDVFGAVETSGDFLGEAVMTGPTTGTYTVVGYGRQALNPPTPLKERVVLIWVDSGEITFLGQGKLQNTHQISYYLPSADADHDGLPDKGQKPIVCLPATTFDTRIGVLPPCVP